MHVSELKFRAFSRYSRSASEWKNLPTSSKNLDSFCICGASLRAISTFHYCKWFGRIRVSASVLISPPVEIFFFACVSISRLLYFFSTFIGMRDDSVAERCFSTDRKISSLAVRETAISTYWWPSLRAPSLNT